MRFIHEMDRFDINGEDFMGWDEELLDLRSTGVCPSTIEIFDRMSSVRSHDDGGILTYSLTKLFTSDKYNA